MNKKNVASLPLTLYGIGCGVSQSLMSLGGTLFAVIGAGSLNQVRNSRLKKSVRTAILLSWSWILFSTLNLLAHGWNERTSHTLGNIPLLWVPLSGFLLPGILSPSRRQFEGILKVTGLAILVSATFASFEFFSSGNPATAFLRNPIYLAYNLLPAAIFFCEMFLDETFLSIQIRRLCGLIAIAAALGIFCTVSRMPMTCLLFYAAFRIMPLWRKKTDSRGATLALLLAVGFSVSLYRLVPAFQEKVARAFSPTDPSRVWREIAWKHNWNLFLNSPIAGLGAERNGIDVAKMPEFQGHWQPNHLYFAHSIYFQMLADSGVIGTTLFLGFWISLALSCPTLVPLLAIVALSGLTENIFNNSKAAHAVFFYTLMTIIAYRLKEGSSDDAT